MLNLKCVSDSRLTNTLIQLFWGLKIEFEKFIFCNPFDWGQSKPAVSSDDIIAFLDPYPPSLKKILIRIPEPRHCFNYWNLCVH